MSSTTIETLPTLIGQQVEVSGWLTGLRSSGKIAFLQLRDGTGFVQGVIAKSDVAEEIFERARRLSQETSVRVVGEVRADERSPSGVELGLSNVEIVASPTDEYPLTPKEHGVDFLMENRHLYLRHKKPGPFYESATKSSGPHRTSSQSAALFASMRLFLCRRR